MTKAECRLIFIFSFNWITKWHICLFELLLLLSLLVNLKIAVKVWIIEHFILLPPVSGPFFYLLSTNSSFSKHYFLWSFIIFRCELIRIPPLWALIDARLLFRVHIPEIVIVRSFHYGILVSWIVEIPIIKKKQLSFVDRKIGWDVFILEGSCDFVEHS